MGKKKKSHKRKSKKANSPYSIKYKSKLNRILDLYDEEYLRLKYPTKEERDDFVRFIIQNEDSYIDDADYSMSSIYDEKLKKVESHKCKNFDDMILTMKKRKDVLHEISKNNKYKNGYKRDLSIASYVNDKKYKKRILSNKKYKKQLKEIVEMEKRDKKDMKRLGYISNKEKLDKMLKKEMKHSNDNYKHALSESYAQKHFIN